ncbi:MAG: hypothetical protein J6Q15_03195, partial [Clostridia bacterium]|nr:hypothetical protein [Clostridia bacterium]
MKLFIKLRNKYFTALMSLVLLVMASIGLFNLSGTIRDVEASMISFDNEKSITITNGSFGSFTSQSSYPHKLNSFTTSGNNTASMKTGVINVNSNTYSKNYKDYNLNEYENPGDVGTKDDYILMINTNEDSNYTYTSSEFTLPANGYYYVTVSAKTMGDSSLASVFLMKDNQVFEDCIISNITTKAWTNYTFFVATNSYESVNLKFGMQIGNQSTPASGCVLFDELHAGQISAEQFANCLQTFPQSTFKMAEFRMPNAYKTYNLDGNTLEFYKDVNGEILPNIVSENYFATNTSGMGEKTVDIDNGIVNISTTNTYVTYKGKEEELQPNTTYRFSISAKVSKISAGSAFVRLDEIIDEEEIYNDFMQSTAPDKTAKSSSLTISGVTTNLIDNDYEEYVIYVNTGALSSSKVQFSFGLGSETTNASGIASFKQFAIERVPYSAYSSATSGSKIGKIDISERISLASSEFSNYTFDKMQSTSFDGVPYPAVPTSWTRSSDNTGVQLSGVVNLSQFNRVMDKYSNTINPMATPASLTSSLNNNVLMIYNGTEASQSYTSTNKSLSANKSYKVTTFVNTHMWNKDANGVTVLAKTNNIVLGKVENIKTSGAWQKVEFVITTPANSVDLTLELALGYGNKLSSGYAFFDNILVEEASEDGVFSNRFGEFEVANNGSKTIDLTNIMLSSTQTREYNTPILFTGKNNSETTINAGIVDLTSDLNVVADSKKEALRALSGDNTKVLGISTALDVDGYYQYTSVLNYNFESNKYYKLSFELFTDGIAQEDKEEKYDNGRLAQGVNIQLTGLENATFKYITSDGAWTNYEFYVGVNATTSSSLIFSLGSEFTGCYGRAFIGNIELSEVDKDVFNLAVVNENVLKIDTVEQTEEETETSETSGTNFNWAYIPTIATFLAIIVAVVGIFVRRNIKFKKRVGNKKAVYDRDITVMQNKYRR